ncbi:MAG TPA: acyl-CoA dehydrogenase family protein [Amycolatopsis sp.]|uniref:acyl-CoA dehydrogenase family protein n=1 Tax=Amycolatopsis sp. TaxID=37632 RepID=UPI002B4AA7E5|nr:acyl-CoA dehydrogenase family protein [Amycolatopsis sp.]HKS49824.1 acyl-CoA dehydrogenase family protein [Amycolatopsis sp.]
MNGLHVGLDADALRLVNAAEALVPALAEHAEDVDRGGHVPVEVFKQVVGAGLLRVCVPKRFGGEQQKLQTLLAISEALGRGCGSTAWVAQNISATAVLVGMFCEQAQRDVWETNPDIGVCASQSPPSAVARVDGGYRISGQWGYLSGVEQAGWALLTMPIGGDPAAPEIAFALAPVTAGTVVQTWNVVGMRGTASNTLVLEDYVVPDHRILSVTKAMTGTYATEYPNETLYRTPLAPSLVLGLLGTPIGVAQGALEHVLKFAHKRGIAYSTFPSQSASTGFQIQVAEAALKIDTARLFAAQLARELDDAATRGVLLEYVDHTRIRAAVGFACQQLREAVQILVNAHGTATFAEVNPLQRMWRDVNTGTRHGMLTPMLGYELYGKSLSGNKETVATLV